MTQDIAIILAGTSGLVGQATLTQATNDDSIHSIYSLSRQSVESINPKLTQWVSSTLTPPIEPKFELSPKVGVIALGTTIKQAGSKEKLHDIDVTLVINVANEMLRLGVQHIIVVSCIGASLTASSHYLRCKGEMESEIEKLHFKRVTFMQPGPLAGPRKNKRTDEKVLQFVLKVVNPIMLGRLANYKAIESSDVAKAIINLALMNEDNKGKNIERINTRQMISLAKGMC